MYYSNGSIMIEVDGIRHRRHLIKTWCHERYESFGLYTEDSRLEQTQKENQGTTSYLAFTWKMAIKMVYIPIG